MLFVEPEVDCFRLHLRTLRMPLAVLDQTPDIIATSEAAAATAVSAPTTTTPPPARTTAEPIATAASVSASEAAPADVVSEASPPLSGRPSATVSASTRASTASSAADRLLPSPLTHITIAERADVIHRALLSTLHARFPYELPDTLEHAYVLVITHHAAPSIADQPLTAEDLSYLTTHHDFLPAELRCRTFPSHLNAVLDPAWAAAAAAASTTIKKGEDKANQNEKRSSIRVTDDAAESRKTAEQRSAEEATQAVLHNVPMAPRFYDSFFLLARDLTPAQQALYYETQCRGRPLSASTQDHLQQLYQRKVPTASSSSSSQQRTGGKSEGKGDALMEGFSVLQGHFTHFVPASAEGTTTIAAAAATPTASGSALATAVQRMSGSGSGGYRRVTGESETFYIRPTTSTIKDASPPSPSVNAAADVRLLHFSVYRIPLTRFQPDDQQYYTDQREELRWRQRRRCRASYRRQRTQSTTQVDNKKKTLFRAGQSCDDDECDTGTSSNSSDADGSDDSTEEVEGTNTCGDEDEHRRKTWRRSADFDDAMEELFQDEPHGGTDAAAECCTAVEQRRAMHFFNTCHKVLTNYAVAHTTSDITAPDTKPEECAAATEGLAVPADNMKSAAPRSSQSSPSAAGALRTTRRFADVSFYGVTRLLYSLAPCDCYHLVMKDNNPLYYAHSSRASYQPQTVPLCLVSDLTLEAGVAAGGGGGGRGGGNNYNNRNNNCSPRATSASARITAAGVPNRDTVMQRPSGEQQRKTAEGGGAAAPNGRPSPTPDLSGQVLWVNQEPPRGSGTKQEEEAAPVVPKSSHKQQRQQAGLPEDGLVRSRQPSPDRAADSRRTSTRRDPLRGLRESLELDGKATEKLSSCTDGFLRVTASLVSNSISGNPRRSEKSLAEKGARVPDFLLPDAARKQRGGGGGGGGAGSSEETAAAAVTAATATASAVVNLFRALSESSLAQHKLRYGSIRPVVSVAVLDSSRFVADSSANGGEGAHRCGTREATQVQHSTRYCCRGLVDHTWLSLPVQHTPAEQEAIQWMPVMLGSTECVSDVGLRTAVHLGIFPPSTPDTALKNSSSNGNADGAPPVPPSENGKSGVLPTREGVLSSLTPSSAFVSAKKPAAETPLTAAPDTKGTAETSLQNPFASPLQPCKPPNVTTTTTTPASAASHVSDAPPPTLRPQPNVCMEKNPSADAGAAAAASTAVKDPDGYAVPTFVVERRGGLSLHFDLRHDPPATPTLRQDDCVPASPSHYRTASTTDAIPQPNTRPSSPRFSHEPFEIARHPFPPSSSAVRVAATTSVASSWTNLEPSRAREEQAEEVEDVPVDVRDIDEEEDRGRKEREASPTAAVKQQNARGGVAVTVDVGTTSSTTTATQSVPATVLARVQADAPQQRNGTSAQSTQCAQGNLYADALEQNEEEEQQQQQQQQPQHQVCTPGRGNVFMPHPPPTRDSTVVGRTMASRKEITWTDAVSTTPLRHPNVSPPSLSAQRLTAVVQPSVVETIELDSVSEEAEEFVASVDGDEEDDEEAHLYESRDGRSAQDATLTSAAAAAAGARRQFHPQMTQYSPREAAYAIAPGSPAAVPPLKMPPPKPVGAAPRAQPSDTTPLSTSAASARATNPFAAFAQLAATAATTTATPHTPPRQSQLPACFSSFKAALPRVPQNTYFDDPLRASAMNPARLSRPPAPYGQPAGMPPSAPHQPAAPYSGVSSTSQRMMGTPGIVHSYCRHEGSASPSHLSLSVSAISHSPNDASVNGRGVPSPRYGDVAPPPPPPPAPRSIVPTKPEEFFDSPEPRRGNGQAPESKPAAYFESQWNTRKSVHASATATSCVTPSPLAQRGVRVASQTTCSQPPESQQQQQLQSRFSFFLTPFGRPATNLRADSTATVELSPGASRDGGHSPRTPRRPAVRQTLGFGRPSFPSHTPPDVPRQQQQQQQYFAHTQPTLTTTRALDTTMCIDEYDDAAVRADRQQRSPGVASRVRPRGVSATDAAWWQPTPELSVAPNLRFSSAWVPGRAASHVGDTFNVSSRTSTNIRLSHSADPQPYNVEPADNYTNPAHYRRDTYNIPRGEAPPTTQQQQPTVRPLSFAQNNFFDAVYPDDVCRMQGSYDASGRLQGHTPFAARRARVTTVNAGSEKGPGCRPPLAPLTSTRQSGYTASPHRYSILPSRRPLEGLRCYSRAAPNPEAERRRKTLQLHRHLNAYQQHLLDNYVCGPFPKRFCFERPPLHPAGVAGADAAAGPRGFSPSSSTPRAGIQILRNGVDAFSAREAQGGSEEHLAPSTATKTTGAASAWIPRTTAIPTCLFPRQPMPAGPNSNDTAAAQEVHNPVSEAARAYSLGVPPASSHAASPLLPSKDGAERAARQAEACLRAQNEQQEHLRVRREMEQLADGEAAARLSSGVNVSFTLRDVAAVFLRLPSTSVKASRLPGSLPQVSGDGDGGVEVLDICQAAWRTAGISCFLSRKPTRLRGGWESYLERINLYQEPFYLRDQAFVLLLPVPHLPELKVCVAIHNINDLVALVCQTPVPRILPSAEEAWMRQRRYGWGNDDDDDGAINGQPTATSTSAPTASMVAVEERRWLFGLFTTRRLVQTHAGGNSTAASSAPPPPSPEDDDATRRRKCRALRRQHQVDGLCLTWRHRMQLWLAFFHAGCVCMTLPSCTSPLLTDPAACKARCALLCDRVAAYAAVRHRLETLKAIRQAYVEHRAEEISRQRVLRLCEAPHLKAKVQLGAAADGTRPEQPYAPAPPQSKGATAAADAAPAQRDPTARVKPGGVAFTLSGTSSSSPLPPSSAWAELHGTSSAPSPLAPPFVFGVRSSPAVGETTVHRRRHPSASLPPSDRFDSPLQRQQWWASPTNAAPAAAASAPIRVDESWQAPRHSAMPPPAPQRRHSAAAAAAPSALDVSPTGMTRAMRLRLDANRRVAHGEAPVASLRHAQCLFPPSDSDVARDGQTAAAQRGVENEHPTTPSTSSRTATPSHLFSAATSTVAPYACGTTLAPSKAAPKTSTTTTTSAAASLALAATASSDKMDLILRVDRDDALAAALQRLTEFRAASIVPPLRAVLSVVPRTAQPVRGAGAGVVDENDDALCTGRGDGSGTTTTPPLYAGFVPSPVELQQTQAQTFNITIAQVQQLLQWQWEHHQHSYTLMPTPLFRGAVVPSADFSLFAASTRENSGAGAATTSARVLSTPYAVSPLARELMLHVVRWAWLLPVDYGTSRSERRGFRRTTASWSKLWPWSLPRVSCVGTSSGRSSLRLRWRRWRLLCYLVIFALIVHHPSQCFVVALSLAAASCTYNGVTVGLFRRLPSHRSRCTHSPESAPRLFLLFGPRLRVPRLWRSIDAHRGRHRHRQLRRTAAARSSPFLFTAMEGEVPPLHDGVSLLHSLSDVTTENVHERRRGRFASHVLVARVLRWQSGAAALLSRVQLFFYGYSTALSMWVALLCLSYLLLFLAYAWAVRRLGHACGTASGSSSETSRNTFASAAHSPLPHGSGGWWTGFSDGAMGVLQTMWSSSSVASSSAATNVNTVASASVEFLSHLSEAAWREVLEPMRFLLLQQVQRAEDAAAQSAALAGTADTDAEEAASANAFNSYGGGEPARAGAARPSYFYQNGRYYAYDAEPPAWAKASVSSSLDEKAAGRPATAPANAHFSMATSHKGTPSFGASTSLSARLVDSVSAWLPQGGSSVSNAAQSEQVSSVIPEVGPRRSSSSSDVVTAAASAVYATQGQEETAIMAEHNASSSTSSANAAHFYSRDVSAEPSLLWFLVLAYAVTVCLPRSPFRWLWRRVWGVLTNDDALARRPLLTV